MKNPAPTDLEETLSASWLTEALSRRYPGGRVTHSAATRRQDNVATKVRFKIDVEPMSSPPPSSWCVKGYWGKPDRYSGGDREGAFCRDLSVELAHYLERLGAYGGHPPEWDEAGASYRRFHVYGYFLGAMTRVVDEEITVEFVKRLGTAVAQHESFEAIGV